MSDVKLEDIVSLAKRRGFIFPGSDVYGGLSGTWDYGPFGLALKKNIMNLWWKRFVEDRDDMLGVDAAILMNQKVWQASGHVDTFTDPLIECAHCNIRLRVDKVVDAKQYSGWVKFLWVQYYKFNAKPKEHEQAEKELLVNYSSELEFYNQLVSDLDGGSFTLDSVQKAQKYEGELASLFVKKTLKCPSCGNQGEFSEPRQFNMMFKTNVGPIDDESSISYLRPETAQGIFTNFKNVVDTSYPDVPFGIAQQGKAFRNEISPRDFVFRSREFEQMEIEYFVHPDKWEEAFEQWRKDIEAFLDELGLPKDKIKEIEVPEEDRAHYSKRTIDYDFAFPHGDDELLGLAYRTDFDLKNIERVSGKSMEYRPKDGGDVFVPHVIEPSFGVERAIMAVLTSAYTEDEINGEKRVYLKLPYSLAPIKVAVCPLAKNNPELVEKARQVYQSLKKELGAVLWIDSGNIGKNYRKMDEIGVPYVVTVDFETLEGDTKDTVTVRNRDTTEQQRSKIINLIALLSRA